MDNEFFVDDNGQYQDLVHTAAHQARAGWLGQVAAAILVLAVLSACAGTAWWALAQGG